MSWNIFRVAHHPLLFAMRVSRFTRGLQIAEKSSGFGYEKLYYSILNATQWSSGKLVEWMGWGEGS